MQQTFTSFLSTLASIMLGCLIPLTVKAQVTSDGTTSTTVNQDGNNFIIEQGDRINDNLFHSFNEFSVPIGGSAGFNNAGDIANIFSRVTGSSVSSIDGLLSANGAANLYLINPNGIIFGQNARLDLGGSFFASTADSLLFEGNTEFSASNPQTPPLLEVSIPIGARFRDNPGDIINRSFVQNSTGEFTGLEVTPGKNLTLLGGNINFEAGEVKASGGNINLGGLSAAGIVDLNEDSSLKFSDNVERANIILSNGADIDARGTGGGNINIHGANVELTTGSFGFAQLRTGILANSTIANAQAGNITINATENFTLNEARIFNFVEPGAVGNGGGFDIIAGNVIVTNGGQMLVSSFGDGNAGNISINASESVILNGTSLDFNLRSAIFNTSEVSGNGGNIDITTPNLTVTNGGGIFAIALGEGNAGNISINASESITLNNTSGNGNFSSAISNRVESGATGNGGEINISTKNLALIDGGQLSANTVGIGNTGNISIDATESIIIGGLSNNGNLSSAIRNRVEQDGTGNGNDLNITTSNLRLIDAGEISASTFGDGDSGNIDIQVESLSLEDETLINANTLGRGNAGQIRIKALNSVSLDASAIASIAEPGAEGNSGGIEINTTNLSLANGSLIDTSSLGQGNAGRITINATGNVSVDGFNSSIFSEIDDNANARGNSEGIEINANNLSLTNRGQINSNSFGNGNSGKILINVVDSITIDSESNISNIIAENSNGNSEGIQITTGNLSITNGGRINSSTFGQGNAGRITIDAAETIFVDGDNSIIASEIGTTARGNSEGIEINTGNLSLTNGGNIDSQVAGIGDAGRITINASDNIFIDGITENGIVSSVFNVVAPGGEGNAGDIQINTNNLSLSNGGQIDASTFGKGDSGDITINATDDIFIDGRLSGIFTTVGKDSLENSGEGNAGVIEVSAANLFFTNGGQISSNTSGIGNAGEINISASESIFANGILSGIVTSVISGAEGNAGDIALDAKNLVLINNSAINASTFSEGNTGKISIDVFETFFAGGNGFTGVVSFVDSEAQGNSEGIEINAPNVFLFDGGTINTRSSGIGNAGDITVNVDSLNIEGNSQIEASNTPSENISTNLGGGNINLNILDSLILRDNGDISARASENANGGNLTINADKGLIIAFPNGDNDITANASQGRGGNIEIFTQGIFGLEERSSTPPNQTNDIDASSEFGLQGDFSLNTPNFDPTTGLINLPASVGDVSDQISQNPCEQGVGSEFTITGKGGLPPNVNQALNSESAQVRLIEPVPQRLSYKDKGARIEANSIPSTSETVPAMGWVFNDKGEVTLTAYSNTDTEIKRFGQQHQATCKSRLSH